MREYDEISEWYTATRSRETGLREVMRIAAAVPRGSKALDVGCGNGVPISQAIRNSGLHLFAVDSSSRMIEAFRRNLAAVPVCCARAEDFDFFDTSFHLVVAWGVVFHLSEDGQRRLIERVAAHLADGGKFLFTSGREQGVREGTMNGVAFSYTSLGSEAYGRLLMENGLRVFREHFDDCENYYYYAEKVRRDPGGWQ